MIELRKVHVPNVREESAVTGEFGATEDAEEGYAPMTWS